jgi:hypothetical protein
VEFVECTSLGIFKLSRQSVIGKRIINWRSNMGIPGKNNEIVVNNGVVIWLDVDDLLVSFNRMFNAHLRSRGVSLCLDFMPQKYSWADIMSADEFNEHFLALGPHWPRDLEVFSGAAEFTRRLKELGCRVILLTSIDSTMLPERLKNLQDHKIYFDEAYPTKGRQKSEFANELHSRYVNARGAPVLNIICDDYGKNVLEFVENVPRTVKGFALDIGYSKAWIKKAEGNRRVNGRARTPQELYDLTLRCIGRLLTRKQFPRPKKIKKT